MTSAADDNEPESQRKIRKMIESGDEDGFAGELIRSFLQKKSKKDPAFVEQFKRSMLELSYEEIKSAHEACTIFGDINNDEYVNKLKHITKTIIAELEESAMYGELDEIGRAIDKTKLMNKVIPESIGKKKDEELAPYKTLFDDAFQLIY